MITKISFVFPQTEEAFTYFFFCQYKYKKHQILHKTTKKKK